MRRVWLLLLFATLAAAPARAAECERLGRAIDAIRREAGVALDARTAQVGASVRIRWRRPEIQGRIPAYLVVAFDRPVRVAGSGLYVLTPGAEAPFGIRRFAGQTRAVIPLYGPAVARGAAFEATFLTAGETALRWDVVGHDGCGEAAAAGDGNRVGVTVTPGGRPALIVGDPIGGAAPDRRFLSADSTRILEVSAGRYRLIDAANGAEIAERAATEPRFSPTGRFVGAQEQNGFTVLDAIDGAKLFEIGNVGDIAWDNLDSFIAAGGSQYGYIAIANSLNNQFPRLDESGLGARCCDAINNVAYRIDLENNLFVIQSEIGVSLRNIANDKYKFSYSFSENDKNTAIEKAFTFGRATSAVLPIKLPKVWETRGKLVFTHLASPPQAEQSPAQKALARLLAVPRPAGKVQARSENTAQSATASIDRSAWRTVPTVTEASAATDRFIKRLGEFGFEFMEVTASTQTVGRFESGYKKELPRAQATKVALQIAKEIPAARGRLEFVEGLACTPETAGKLNSNINVARRWPAGKGTTIWLTWLGCVEGNAAFNNPVLQVFDGARRRIISFNDAEGDLSLRNLGSDAAPACDYTVDSCLANAVLQAGRYLVLTSHEGQAFAVHDLETGKLVAKRFGLSRGPLLDRVLLSRSLREATQINTDGTFFTYRLSDGAELFAGRVIDDEVVVALPDGRFDATAEGAEMVRLRFPGLAGEHALAQFASKLRVPGLLAATLAGRAAPAGAPIGTPPRLSARIERGEGRIRIAGRADGAAPIAAIRLFEDGLLTGEHPYPVGGGGLTLDVAPLPGTRWVSLVAIDAAGLASAPIGRDVGASDAPRGLHVVAAGVNRYDDPTITGLDTPRRDAAAFTEALASASPTLALRSRLMLADADASPKRIADSLAEAIAAAGPGETVMLFFAGHGVRDPSGRFYLATSGTRRDDLPGTALGWDSLAPILGRAKGRVVVLLDTCHSGAAGTDFFATNDAAAATLLAGVPSNIVILSASKGRELAQETAEGGAFTRALVDVIGKERAAHDLNRNGVIELSELHRGVKAKVLRSTGGRQTPWFARNQMVGDLSMF